MDKEDDSSITEGKVTEVVKQLLGGQALGWTRLTLSS